MLSKFLNARPGIYVQPRMGVASIISMADGLRDVKELQIPTIGTITLDAYTRLGQFEEAKKALKSGLELNGFPILAYPPDEIVGSLSSLIDNNFLIQVRHGTPLPEEIFKRLIECGLFLTEGGPISYCLPYSRSPLRQSIASWRKACQILAQYPAKSHLESFGGCLLGQLCHPSVLIAIGILEAIFFQKHGLQDISLSYAQQYNISQDLAAVSALKRLVPKYLNENIDWHIVIYTFMGLFPLTYHGFENILKDSAYLTHFSGARRLIVKTHEESHQIPSIQSNLEALKQAYEYVNVSNGDIVNDSEEEDNIYSQAKSIIDAVLNLDENLEEGLYKAFQTGILDVPFCLHPDNRRLAICVIDEKGYLQWISRGKLPINIKDQRHTSRITKMTSDQFLHMLEYNRLKYDNNQ